MKEKIHDVNSGRLLTRKEAAEYLQVKEITLAIWHSTKRYKIPVAKMGRLTRYRLSDLNEFIEKNMINKINDVANDN